MQNKLINLLLKGEVERGDFDNEEDAAIDLLKTIALKDPELLMNCIIEALNLNSFTMLNTALAAFLCGTEENILTNNVKKYIQDMLIDYNSAELLDLTEIIKSKIFGRGLGSKNQKIIRGVLESWSIDLLQTNIDSYPLETIDLVKLVHPRFTEESSKAMKKLLKDD
jgi:hypothetical protein